MSIVKIPGLIAAAVGFHKAFTAPAISKAQDQINPTFLERYLVHGPLSSRATMKAAVWFAALAECAVIIASRIPEHPIARHLLRAAQFRNGDPQRLAASSMFLVGAALIVTGAYIREHCYKALGNLFTFERTIRSGHRLVTSGPYSVVRHPGYAALIPVYLGIGMLLADPNSWLWQSSVLDTSVARMLVGSLVVSFAISPVTLLRRVPKEDTALEKEFGEEWTRWAKRVPYALIPGIY